MLACMISYNFKASPNEQVVNSNPTKSSTTVTVTEMHIEIEPYMAYI